MVAPTRTPQARGVKCELCKKILAKATWLDQNKLAQNVQDAETVLNLIEEHTKSDCPCIPRNIEYLLTGSTHFEVHRLVLRRLDDIVHKKQYDYYHDCRQRDARETSRNKNKVVNDCDEITRTSRFNLYTGYYDKKSPDMAILSAKHLRHLIQAIGMWRKAMEDTASPFNSKLALRLGLTHHVIYACYLFKYYKLLDQQLATANLLLNLFKSIEGVTQNAILHAYYLLVRTLLDCNQIHLARQNLKQATKMANYSDKTYYESILLTCISCELNLLIGDDSNDNLDLLASLAKLQTDDKLQHYYARTYALSIIIKYIHKYPSRSEFCFEIHHTFRYLSAIIRRCYECSFELILFEKDTNKLSRRETNVEKNQILDYSWIRFAVCDFVFSTFELCSNFYIKSGQPESLQLLYNGLNLVTYRNGSCYWQARMALIGANLDLLCDKSTDAKAKLDAVCYIINYSSDCQLMNLLRLDLEVNRLNFDLTQMGSVEHGLALDLLTRVKSCQQSLMESLSKIELYDCDTSNTLKTQVVAEKESTVLILDNGVFAQISSKCLKIAITSLQHNNQILEAKNLVNALGSQLTGSEIKTLSYYESHNLLEILVSFADVERSQEILLEAIRTSDVFLLHGNGLKRLESQLSMLTIADSETNQTPKARRKNRRIKPAIRKLALNRKPKRRGTYDVASRSEENLSFTQNVRYFDTWEAVKNFETLTSEELIACYLRNSEPNPDYLIYRKANELLLAHRLRDQNPNLEQLLYHFCESSTSNTMRYRWMMLEEQHLSPYEPHKTYGGDSHLCPKHLGFVGMLLNNEKLVKSFIRSIPEDFRLVQLKYIMNKKCQGEHLLIAAFDNRNEPIFIQTTRTLESDDFFEDARVLNEDSLSLPRKISTKIEEAKKTLFYSNQRLRSEKREELERELGLLLRDLEDELLGPFRFILSGKTNDFNYNIFIREIVEEIQLVMNEHHCSSKSALSLAIENGPLLSREEFRQLIAVIFGCPSNLNVVTECFNKWLRAIQPFIESQNSKLDKTAYLQKLTRSQVGLILDKELEHVPFESLPMLRIEHQGIFRVPSLRLFSMIANQHCIPSLSIDTNETAYILDPANNLEKTRQRFSAKLGAQKAWNGIIGQAPNVDKLEQWLSSKELFMFIGHGAGTTYYNKLRKNRGLSSMPTIKPISIVMGCSSGRVMAEGPKLENFGINWVFILRGAPAYLGLLWDVTDTDIDKFLDSLLVKWIGSSWNVGVDNMADPKGESGEMQQSMALTDAVAQVRNVCKLKLLIGSTPVIYGLPICCKN